jgi:hypothetical protein
MNSYDKEVFDKIMSEFDWEIGGMNSYDKEVFDEIMSEFDWEGALSVSALLGIDTSIDEMKRSAVQALTEFFSMDSDIRSTDFIGGFIRHYSKISSYS